MSEGQFTLKRREELSIYHREERERKRKGERRKEEERGEESVGQNPKQNLDHLSLH